MQRCRFCQEENPDHLGRHCEFNPFGENPVPIQLPKAVYPVLGPYTDEQGPASSNQQPPPPQGTSAEPGSSTTTPGNIRPSSSVGGGKKKRFYGLWTPEEARGIYYGNWWDLLAIWPTAVGKGEDTVQPLRDYLENRGDLDVARSPVLILP